MASDQSWKEKYLREVEAAELREKQWQAERNTLERMLVRTSLASEGQTPELDKLLARIRKDLRKSKVDLDSWRQLQEQIDRQIALLDERSDGASTPSVPPVTETAPNSKPVTPDSTDIADKTQRLRIARRVGQLLGQLLSQVSLAPDAEAGARKLQQSLLSSDNWDELREGLNHVAELVISVVTQSKREFEAFLKRLDERLESLRSNFEQQSSVQGGRVQSTEALDQEIRAELRKVDEQLRSSQNLDDLKVSVTRHLASIADALSQFRAREEERERLLTEQMVTMQEKVAAMEAHSEQMQEQVARERERAMTDLLTQLPNREAWQERLSFEFNRWKRYRNPLSVAVIDIDHFKRVNDSYGHKAGDRVLQLVARELRNRLRTTDFLARFGGEEFVVVFPETDSDTARDVLDSLRSHVAKLPFHFGGKPVQVTLSAGVSGFRDDDNEDRVFERADRALYIAKDAGRNRTSVL